MILFLVSKNTRLLFLLLNLVVGTIGYSQEDQKAIVYSEQLVPVDFDSLARTTAIVFVTNQSCVGCVEYFANERIATTFVYFIDQLSIVEMARVRFQETKNPSCTFYYALRNFAFEPILVTEKSPLLMIQQSSSSIVYNYAELSQLTHSFTLKGRQARKITTIQ